MNTEDSGAISAIIDEMLFLELRKTIAKHGRSRLADAMCDLLRQRNGSRKHGNA